MIWQIISLILAITSFYFGVKASKKRKLLVLNIYYSSAKELIIQKVGDITLSYKDQVYSNITSLEYLFFNEGTDAIDGDDILSDSPIILQCDQNSAILDFAVRSESNAQITASLERTNDKSISLKFLWLPRRSGIRLKLLCSGENPQISLKGKIRGLPPLREIKSFQYRSLYSSVNDRCSHLEDTYSYLRQWAFIAVVGFIIFFMFKVCSGPDKSAHIYPPTTIHEQQKQITNLLAQAGLLANNNPITDSSLVDTVNVNNFKIIHSWHRRDFVKSLRRLLGGGRIYGNFSQQN